MTNINQNQQDLHCQSKQSKNLFYCLAKISQRYWQVNFAMRINYKKNKGYVCDTLMLFHDNKVKI